MEQFEKRHCIQHPKDYGESFLYLNKIWIFCWIVCWIYLIIFEYIAIRNFTFSFYLTHIREGVCCSPSPSRIHQINQRALLRCETNSLIPHLRISKNRSIKINMTNWIMKKLGLTCYCHAYRERQFPPENRTDISYHWDVTKRQLLRNRSMKGQCYSTK